MLFDGKKINKNYQAQNKIAKQNLNLTEYRIRINEMFRAVENYICAKGFLKLCIQILTKYLF